MNKKQIIDKIIAEMRAEIARAKAEHDAAYFTALGDMEFARLDRIIRDLTASGRDPKALGLALNEQKKIFAKYYTPKNISVCAKCKGTGWYAGGKLCGCAMAQFTKALTEKSGLSSNEPKNFTLTNVFHDETTKKEYSRIYKLLEDYCKDFPPDKVSNLLLSGGTGTGKTYAAQIVANKLLERGFSVLYITAFGLIQRFKDFVRSFNDTSETDDLFDADLLIIDDLGTEPQIRNISQEYLYNVINERLTANKPFVITTNLSPSALFERYDQRIASRILSKAKTAVIEMKSKDLRI